MSEALNCERWREATLPRGMCISIRKGKMAADSAKHKHPNGAAMTQTTWSLGMDDPVLTTTAADANRDVWSATRSVMPRVYKNASTPGMFSGYSNCDAKQHFSTVARLARSTTCHKDYKRSQPAFGFDRTTANRTNYTLGNESAGLQVTMSTSHSHFHPVSRGQVQQSNVGGWHVPCPSAQSSSTYFNEVNVRESVKRGGSGAAGVLGYDFNIITGNRKEHVTQAHCHLKERIPRVTRNVMEKVQSSVDPWGDSDVGINIINGRPRPQPHSRP